MDNTVLNVITLQTFYIPTVPRVTVQTHFSDHKALHEARKMRSIKHSQAIHEIQIHRVSVGMSVSIDLYLHEGKSPIVYRAKRMSPTGERSLLWREEFFGCFGSYVLEPLPKDQPLVASSKMFAVVATVEFQSCLAGDELHSLEDAQKLAEDVRKMNTPVKIFSDTGLCSVLS